MHANDYDLGYVIAYITPEGVQIHGLFTDQIGLSKFESFTSGEW